MNRDVFRPRAPKLKLDRHPQVDKIVARLLQHSNGGTKAYVLHTTSPYRYELVVNYDLQSPRIPLKSLILFVRCITA